MVMLKSTRPIICTKVDDDEESEACTSLNRQIYIKMTFNYNGQMEDKNVFMHFIMLPIYQYNYIVTRRHCTEISVLFPRTHQPL